MDAKKTLDRIYAMLSGEKVELATAKLEDGTTVRAESFEAGNDVFVVTEEEEIPAPVGEHTLEGGQILVVEEEGKIAETSISTLTCPHFHVHIDTLPGLQGCMKCH
mgnify:CR=1 FL=1